jgi:hypothetical protein
MVNKSGRLANLQSAGRPNMRAEALRHFVLNAPKRQFDARQGLTRLVSGHDFRGCGKRPDSVPND